MEVYNINEKIRLGLFRKYYPNKKVKVVEFLEDMSLLKHNDYEKYKNLILNLYPAFYIVNSEFIESIKETEMYKNESYDTIYEDFDEQNDLQLYNLDEITDKEDLLEKIENDEAMLVDILKNNLSFVQTGKLKLREILNKYKDKDSYLLSFSKLWFIDRLDYCHTIDKEELLYKTSFIKDPIYSNDDNRFLKLDYMGDYLEMLKFCDYDNYVKLVSSVADDCYKYQKYLLTTEPDKPFEVEIKENLLYIEQDLKNDLKNNRVDEVHLNLTLDYFLEFNEQSEETRKKVKKLF